jgi:hypothetical protein
MKITRSRLSGEMNCSGMHLHIVIFKIYLGVFNSNTINFISFSLAVLASVIVEVFVVFAAFAVHL